MGDFITKDSGERQQFSSGMQRDTQTGKLRFDLAFDGPLMAELFRESPAVTAFLTWYNDGGIEQGAEAVTQLALYLGVEVDELLVRYAALMTRGAEKYTARNWMLAQGVEEFERFRASACRHFVQAYLGQEDEDHLAAVFFNINGTEYVREQWEDKDDLGLNPAPGLTVTMGFEAN